MNAVTTQETTALNVTMGFGDLASFEFLQRSAKAFASSSMVPTAYQAMVTKGYGKSATIEPNPAAVPNCMIALDMAQRMNANPLMVMQNLHIIEGRPSWSSQFIISAINSSGKFSPLRFDLVWLDEMDATHATFEWVDGKKVEKKHKVRIKNARCVAWAIEKATGERLESAPVTMEMAVNEGWFSKNGSKWKSMPDLMMRYRSAAFFGRIYAPELLMGLPTAEELHDVFSVSEDGEVEVEGRRAVPPSSGVAEVVRQPWADDAWQTSMPKLVKGILDGKTIEAALQWASAKAPITPAQEQQLRDAVAQAQEQAQAQQAAQHTQQHTDPAALQQRLQEAPTLDALYEAADLIDTTQEPHRAALSATFDARQAALEGAAQ